MKLRSLLKIYLFYLVILYKYYEADTETDKVVPHFSSCYGSFCLLGVRAISCICITRFAERKGAVIFEAKILSVHLNAYSEM